MNEASEYARIFAGRRPCLAEITDVGAISTAKNPRNDLLGFTLQLTDPLALFLQDPAQFGGEGELPALSVFRLARLKPEPAVCEVDVPPLTADQFAAAPSGYVGRARQGSEILG